MLPKVRQYLACVPAPILTKGLLQNLRFCRVDTAALLAYFNSMLAV
jgi:hypothetical protein